MTFPFLRLQGDGYSDLKWLSGEPSPVWGDRVEGALAPLLEEGLVGGLGCWGVAGSGREPGTRGPLLSGVTETTAASRGLDFGIWYQTATSPLNKGPTSSDGEQDRGLGRPPPTSRLPPQPAGSGAPIEPPTSAPSAQGPGAGEPAATPPSCCPQAALSPSAPGGGGRLSPGPGGHPALTPVSWVPTWF